MLYRVFANSYNSNMQHSNPIILFFSFRGCTVPTPIGIIRYMDSTNAYHDHSKHHVHGAAADTKEEYRKLGLVFCFILLVSLLMTHVGGDWHWMLLLDYVMGIFFLMFGMFKLFEYQMFSHGYKDYDLIAQKLPWWGRAYPLVEILLGILYVLHVMPLWLNAFVVVLLSVNAYGVWRTIKNKPSDMPACLCLGAVVKLPLSTISMLENVSMGAMALAMLVALLLGVPNPA